MQKEKTNIEHLRVIIEKEMFNRDEALEFLDTLESEHKKQIRLLNEELTESETENDFLNGNKIDCGIGIIEWTADNLQLELLMENLEERIKEHGALKTMRMLQIPVTA